MKPTLRKINLKENDVKQVVNPKARHAYFANSFSLNISSDDVILGFGQKITDPDISVTPVRETRHKIVMTYKGARVLFDLLKTAVKEIEEKSGGRKA